MKKVPTYCDQCYNGPDLFTMVVDEGVVHSVEPNPGCRDISPAEGKICVKAFGLVQKMYNPDRIKSPLVRTNPKKGKDEDPGWKEISWDEALDLLAGKLKEARAKGLVDEGGFPRLAVIMGQAASPAGYAGTLPAFLSAWGPIDFTVGGGQGIKCYHSEHLFCEYWHRCFIGAADTPRAELVISFGHNTNASGGAAGVLRHAQARDRGYKRIQVEPHLSVSGTTSDEWVPIKVKTDAAFMYALIHVLLFENDRGETCDLPFLRKRTSSPYLVGPNGYFMRDRQSKSPLVWDAAAGEAKTHDALAIGEFALEGEYTVSGVEIGPDGREWEHEGVRCKPSFQLLIEFMEEYTPEWAAEVCDVPVETIRGIAREIIEHAHIGETIDICGESLPYRPVAFILGKTVNNGPGGYQTCWARTVLAMLLGALEVPGGTIGASQRLNKPHHDRWSSIWPGRDGFMRNALNPTDKKSWPGTPKTRTRYMELLPLVLNTGWSPFLSPTPLAWKSMGQDCDDVPRTTFPDVVLLYRANPAISMYFTKLVHEKMARFPFFACVGYTLDETNHFADLILPDHTDLEGLQLFRIGPSVHSEAFWSGYGFALRQPAVPPVVNSIDMTDFATELAARVGLLEGYNDAINAGLVAGPRLRTEAYDYELDVSKKYAKEDLWDRLCKAATMALSNGEVEHGLDWFREHGYYAADYPLIRHFLHPVMVRWGLRYEVPYQENIRRIGKELGNRLHENDIDWWDEQLHEYEALPKCEDFSKVWDDICTAAGADPDEYGFWLVNTRSMQYAWGSNAAIPMMAEAAKNVPGFKGVLINRSVAEKRGIQDGDIVMVESVNASVRARAVLREGVRPDTVVFTGQFGHWKTPFARELGIPNLNSLTDPKTSVMDSGGSSSDVVKVRIRKET
ncbi:MAG: molybdopterin-dependent oxidoreductase [Planctomycetota bacterium]|jgi:phenylacetyl-CoA:acceptor oxidoreductase